MQIGCPICKKTFKVDASLIPDQGRLLQCGFCNHKWFFKEEEKLIETLSTQPAESNKNLQNFELPRETEKIIKQAEEQINMKTNRSIYQSTQQISEITINDNNQNLIEKILSTTIVGIISFVAIIILVDTFKTPLNKIFPKLEYLIFSLYETLKDVKLFIIDLI